ncbi:MAG: DNA polymerase [Candidatus Cloacimonadaceae bacterium]
MYENYCTVDIETTAIPAEGILAINKIHCIGVKSNSEPTKMYTSRFLPLDNYGGTLRNALDVINTHDYCIGHNFIGFDNIVISNLLGEITATILDTMILAKLLYTKDELEELDYTISDFPKARHGSFSLDAFGRRMGIYKGSHNNWNELSIDMANYCTQDVEVTYNLFINLIEHPNYPSNSIIALENEVAYIIAKQQYYGFYYNIDEGRELLKKLMYEKLTIELKLSKIFKSLYLPDGQPIIPANSRKNKLYIPDENYKHLTAIAYHPYQYKVLKNGKVKHRGKSYYKWFTTPHRLVYSYTEGEYQKIKLTKFDPGSRHKIRHWLKIMYNFTFNTFTEKGNPKVDGEQLTGIPEAKDLMRYLKLTKDISEVRGILDIVKEHSHSVHGRVDTLGAATHRCTHSSPNVAQTSADPIFRTLYTVPDGYELVGADLANIEVRVLAHYLYQYDNGEYAKAVLSKDMHWYHSSLSGFIESGIEYDEHNPIHKAARDKSKKFFFGYLYGQGDTIRGHILWTDGCLPDYTEEEYNLAKERIIKRLVIINDLELFPLRKDEYVEYNELLILKTIYGKRIADTFLERMTGIKELIADCSRQSRETGYIQAIDGRLLYSRSPHSALNLLLQGSAGIIAKQWMVNYNKLAEEAGMIFGRDYWQSAYIHDEYVCTCLPEYSKILGECLEKGAFMVTKQFNMNLPIKADAVSGLTWQETH